MKNLKTISIAALLLASLSIAQAQTTIAAWNFENLAITNYSPNPAPSLNNCIGAVSVASIGMNIYATPGVGTNDPDIAQGVSGDSSTLANGGNGITNLTRVWRVRAQKVGNGWSSAAPAGTQGAQFNVDTTGFTNLLVSFDWYLTKAGEANLQLEYTVNGGSTWSNIPITIPAAQSGSSLQLVDNTAGSDPNSVQGYYVNCLPTTGGQQWFTNLTATISDPAVANNPLFAVKMVNASTGASCVDGTGSALNNSSGNWRFDNLTISGTSSGAVLTPPTITPSSVATVDGPFTNTFPDNNNWRNNISSVKVNSTVLTAGYAVSAGKIIFTPSASVPANLLQTAGSISISIASTGYSIDTTNQYIAPGAPKRLTITTQPTAPTGNGGTLVTQPMLEILDQYNNIATNGIATYTATPSSGWGFGTGSGAAQMLTNGTITFTNLSAVVNGSSAVSATITFTASGASGLDGLPYTTTNSSAFLIPAPAATGFTPGNLAVYQADAAAANSTISILELSPTTINQSSPVNTFAISATGANTLRTSSAGTTGRLATSNDGTLVCFAGFEDGSSATADETTILPRGAATLDHSGNFILQASYTGISGNQARSATSVDNNTWYIGDKGGVYTNGLTSPAIGGTGSNVRSLKSFGGTVYALQQFSSSLNRTVLSTVVLTPDSQQLDDLAGLPEDANVLDFYMVQSGQNGSMYDTLYYIDGTNSTSGAIFKYYTTDGVNWNLAGSATTANGGDGLCAATNAIGGVDLYYTTGNGGMASNSVIKVHDSAPDNTTMQLSGFQTLFTTSSNATLKGVAFAPASPVTAPSVTTLAASNITAGSAALNATVNPDGGATAYWFQYGTNNLSYDHSTPTNSLSAGLGQTPVSCLISNLLQGTKYYYQIVATNSVSRSSGIQSNFTTLAVIPSQLIGTADGGVFSLSFTNVTGANFSVLSTNNLTIPAANWLVVGQAIETPAGSGNYQYINSSPTNPVQFYRLRSN